MDPHEMQARATIAAALIQARGVNVDFLVATIETNQTREEVQRLKSAVEKIYTAIVLK